MNFFEIHKYPARKNFPVYGNINRLYIDLESNKFYYWQDGKYFKISTTELDQATYDDLNRTLSDTYETIVNSDNKLALKANKTYVDTKVDKPEGSPNNYFSESNEYLPLQRFARVRYQSSTGWAKVAEVTLPTSADERKSAIFFINCENNTSTTSESWFGILEWNIHETPASNSIKWLVTYGFGENNFNIRYHSDTNTLSFFVLPSVGNMNLWLASESTNGRVTSDIVLFDADDKTSRTGLSVAAKADYLTHAGHVRDTRKVADIALSGDISTAALIDALKASGSSDTDKLTTVGLVADMFAELVNGAPAALDTLQELAQALDEDPNFATTITNLIGTKADKTYVDDIANSFNDTNTIPLVEVTWQELKDLRDNLALVPGQQYRITDYMTTTVQENTQSAGHLFDIIVTADSADKLNEIARACLHEGDTYFANSKLEVWQLKYCLDNDTSRFAWADEMNGKGVIYRMIDEFNNDCPYDFKNIQFKRKLTDGELDLDSGIDTWVYTFTISDLTADKVVDISLKQNTEYNDDEGQYKECANNSVKEAILEYQPDGLIRVKLNDNVFLNSTVGDEYYGCYSNTFGYNCYNNTFGKNCYNNTFGNDCSSNTIVYNCHNNTFGNGCYSNTFGENCYNNIFGNGCENNTFGDYCNNNTFGNDCYSNTFGNECNSNTFGNNCSSNTIGYNCYNNTFGNSCYGNTFGENCSSNAFGNSCQYLQISDASSTKKQYIHVENGTRGASRANKFDLYDSAIMNKEYQVTFSKDAVGNYIMKWHNTLLTYTGKYKTSSTDNVWKDITPVETYE